MQLLKQKQIKVDEITIKKEETGRFRTTIYTKCCDESDGNDCPNKVIGQVISKVLNEKMTLCEQACGLRKKQDICTFSYMSKDKHNLQIGIAKSTKSGSPVSGDTSIQTKLKDGKYLIGLSDGMGSGPEARKSSKIAIKMLERLLKTGFDKDKRIKFVGSVYNQEILRRLRKNASAYIHGHSAGGTNPSLLEALSITDINILYNVCYNEEVGKDAALYFSNERNSLSNIIDKVEKFKSKDRLEYGEKAKKRIIDEYTWDIVVNKYKKFFDSILK